MPFYEKGDVRIRYEDAGSGCCRRCKSAQIWRNLKVAQIEDQVAHSGPLFVDGK